MILESNHQLPFGRYRGQRVVDLYVGNRYPAQELTQQLLQNILLGQHEIYDGQNRLISDLNITELDFLCNNHIGIKANFKKGTMQDFIAQFNYGPALMAEHYPDKLFLTSPNDFVRKVNSERQTNHPFFADYDYLYWCIGKAKGGNFAIADLEVLEKIEVNCFTGIKFKYVEDVIINYEVQILSTCLKIPTWVKEANSKKLNLQSSAEVASSFDDSAYDSA